jgi:hypothetical protein
MELTDYAVKHTMLPTWISAAPSLLSGFCMDERLAM